MPIEFVARGGALSVRCKPPTCAKMSVCLPTVVRSLPRGAEAGAGPGLPEPGEA